MQQLQITQLSVVLQEQPEKQIITNLSLQVQAGQTHVIMGPNGSGKSSLLATLMGHPAYHVTHGSVQYNTISLLDLRVDQRAQAGIFLTMQQPYAIPGVIFSDFLKESFQALYPQASLNEYLDRLLQACDLLEIPKTLLDRPLYEGFSGGEKKRGEMLQLLVLRPSVVLLDELDSGLDADALKKVLHALKVFKQESPEAIMVCVTHYGHMVQHLQPDRVHVMQSGKLMLSGDTILAEHIITQGYQSLFAQHGLV